MKIHCIGHRLTKNFAWELAYFNFIRKFSDGITFFNFLIDFDLFKEDHNPQFRICLTVLNTVIFEFQIYNTNHIPEELYV
jgi:hypothetical protein